MMISGNRLFIGDDDQGVIVFDLFANYLYTIPISGSLIDMDVTDKWIYASTDRSLMKVDKKGMNLSQSKVVLEHLAVIDVEDDILHWGDGEIIYSTKLNSLFE